MTSELYPPPRPDAITAEWLRQRFSSGSPARTHQSDQVQDLQQMTVPLATLRPAAVLIPLVLRPGGMTVLLTKRTAHLKDHADQVSFPGGRCEPEDGGPIQTAIREANEEVGLEPNQIEVLGTLPDYDTGTGFHVVPVVALIHLPLQLKLDAFEVADVFEPPLSFVFDHTNHQRHRIEARGKLREFWAISWEGYYVWGATASMLVNLCHYLFDPISEIGE